MHPEKLRVLIVIPPEGNFPPHKWCVCVCAYVHVCKDACTCLCIGSHIHGVVLVLVCSQTCGRILGVSLITLHLLHWRRGHETQISLICRVWLSGNFPSVPTGHWNYMQPPGLPGILHGIWRSKPWSSHLYCKPFTYWAISHSPTFWRIEKGCWN